MSYVILLLCVGSPNLRVEANNILIQSRSHLFSFVTCKYHDRHKLNCWKALKSCRSVTINCVWAHMGPQRKPFETTPWRPMVRYDEVLLISPSSCGPRTGLRHIWGAGIPGTPFSIEASKVLQNLEARGFLRSFRSHEVEAYKAYISELQALRGCDSEVWITPILHGVKCNFELIDLLRQHGHRDAPALLPKSSLRWPHLSPEVAVAVRAYLDTMQ